MSGTGGVQNIMSNSRESKFYIINIKDIHFILYSKTEYFLEYFNTYTSKFE